MVMNPEGVNELSKYDISEIGVPNILSMLICYFDQHP